MSIESLNQFYWTLQILKIKVIDTSKELFYLREGNMDDQKELNLMKLRESVLTELLTLNKEQIKYHLNRLKAIYNRFSDFRNYYDGYSRESYKVLEYCDFLYELHPFFIEIDSEEDISLTKEVDISAILIDIDLLIFRRRQMILDLISMTKYYTGIDTEDNKKLNLTQPKKLLSYKWVGDLEDLGQLYDILNGTLIQKTKKEDFIAAFSGEVIGSFKPIKWHDNNATEAIFFIKSLMPELVFDERKRMNYDKFIGCFIKADGTCFDTKSLKTLNRNAEVDLSMVKKLLVKDLISRVL